MKKTIIAYFDSLKKHYSGEIIMPGDSNYEQASTAFIFKGTPKVIFKPDDEKGVATAIEYAINNSLILSVRSGGHSNAGFGTNNGGVIIDLSKINSIQVIDEANHIVRIGGAMNTVPADATAFAYRNSESLLIAPMFLPPNATEEVIQGILKPWEKVKSFGKGAYSGFISTNTEEDVRDVYPEGTYEKLAKIKKKYDPQNIFNQNYNIKPE